MQFTGQVHASCVARDGHGVLLLGPSGAGKSDLALRLLSHGFILVADDRVDITGDVASAPASLAGLLEVRGLGIVRLPRHTDSARLALIAELGPPAARLPFPAQHTTLHLPLIRLDPAAASAPDRVALALDCVLGCAGQVAGAFAA